MAIDIDGTLINTSMQLTAPTRQAIAGARLNGVRVTLATGRSYNSAKNYADRLGLDAPLICSNGAIIRHRDGTILSEESLDSRAAYPLLAEMAAEGLYTLVYHKDGIFTSGKTNSLVSWLGAIGPKRPKLGRLAYSLKEFRLCRVRKLSPLKKGEDRYIGHKIFTAGPRDKLDGFQRQALALGFSVDYYPETEDCMYLEVTNPGISKGWALAKLAGHYGLDMAQVAAIGDNLNDHTMIQAAGLGIVMGNGHSQLKDIAGEVTLTNDEDGVAAAIHRLILQSPAQAG